MKQEEIRFKIDQLRKDKIIYAVEACATSLACFVVLFSLSALITSPFIDYLAVTSACLALGYTLYMGISNLKRLREIKKLEKMLEW